MSRYFFHLLRSNFRCGRMFNSRADDMAGCFAVPTNHLQR
jgi:hypothetical protein